MEEFADRNGKFVGLSNEFLPGDVISPHPIVVTRVGKFAFGNTFQAADAEGLSLFYHETQEVAHNCFINKISVS